MITNVSPINLTIKKFEKTKVMKDGRKPSLALIIKNKKLSEILKSSILIKIRARQGYLLANIILELCWEIFLDQETEQRS